MDRVVCLASGRLSIILGRTRTRARAHNADSQSK